MSTVKCFDVVESVTEEATKRFAPIFRENAERKDILKQYCSALDQLIEDISGNSIEVEVDEIKMTVSVAIGCDEVIIYPDNDLFYKLAERALVMKFYPDEDDQSMVMEFVFPSIWEKVI